MAKYLIELPDGVSLQTYKTTAARAIMEYDAIKSALHENNHKTSGHFIRHDLVVGIQGMTEVKS